MTIWLDNQLPPALGAWVQQHLGVECSSVRDLDLQRASRNVPELVWRVAASLPRPDVSAGQPWTRARIRLEVHRIIGEQVGRYAFHSRDRLVDDIGID